VLRSKQCAIKIAFPSVWYLSVTLLNYEHTEDFCRIPEVSCYVEGV